jgi:putative ABC transport system ATP-binding protein
VSPNNELLRAQSLGRQVGEKVLVQDASFEVRQGEILALTGPSGSGKTSLRRLLNRLDEPSQGTVFLQGMDYREIPPRELRRKIGMLTQRPFLFPVTVAENLQYGPRQRGELLSPQAINELLESVGLPAFATRDVANLSGGEAQRVSLARTLANGPVVMLLDEPTSALDDAAKTGIEGLIREIVRQRGLTCVIVTHDTAQAVRLADRALLIEAGRIVRQGAVKEVLHA